MPAPVMPRVFVAGFWHETNTFSAVPADRAAFASFALHEGAAMHAAFAGTNTEIGGMIAAAAERGLELVPGFFAGALPSGPCRRGLFEGFLERLRDLARQAGAVDGVLLALHGAMVAEGHDEADAAIVAAVRAVVGPDCPIVATFDLHANLSPALVDASDILVGYRTNPHVDMAERGREAVLHLQRLIAGAGRPQAALVRLPLVSVSQTQVTADAPMREVMAARDAVAAQPGVVTASVAVGYPYADVGQLGMSVLVYADRAEAASAAAESVAALIWQARDRFVPEAKPVPEAIAEAERIKAAAAGPVILVDVADNIGGGAPGDGTAALAGLLVAGAQGAAVVLWDPEAARAAVALGEGAQFAGPVGARSDRLHGEPVRIAGPIVFARAVDYVREGPWMTGQHAKLGAVARIDIGGVHVVLTETRVLPYDRAHLAVVGLPPEDLRMIVVKAAAGWRTPFEPIMAGRIYLDTPGVHAPNLARFTFHKRPRPLFPLERDAAWTPRAAAAA